MVQNSIGRLVPAFTCLNMVGYPLTWLFFFIISLSAANPPAFLAELFSISC